MNLSAVRVAPTTGPFGPEERALPEETAVAFVYNGSTQAVMMATPADLEDFAVGFTLSEGLAVADEIGPVEVAEHDSGLELRMWLPQVRADGLAARRRAMAGPVGCGLCGIDSLAAAIRPLPRVAEPDWRIGCDDLAGALEALRAHQPLHDETRAVHAAGFWRPGGGGITHAREDVGRHNALDKLIGALARDGLSGGMGMVVLTSRISVEMIQKAAILGTAVVAAISAPTAQAVRLADRAGITLASVAGGRTRIFTHPRRLA